MTTVVNDSDERCKLISDINNSINEMSNEELIFVSDLLKRLIRLDEIAKDEMKNVYSKETETKEKT